MPLHRSLAASLWLLAAAGAYAVLAAWADDARSGKIPPWTLVVMFWSVALVSVSIHHLSIYLSAQLAQAPDTLKRCSALSRQWRLGMKVRVKRFGRQRLHGHNSVARRTTPAETPHFAAHSPSSAAAATAWATALRRVAEAGALLERAWAAAMLAVLLHLSNALTVALAALKRCWLQVQPVVAARLGALIGVR